MSPYMLYALKVASSRTCPTSENVISSHWPVTALLRAYRGNLKDLYSTADAGEVNYKRSSFVDKKIQGLNVQFLETCTSYFQTSELSLSINPKFSITRLSMFYKEPE